MEVGYFAAVNAGVAAVQDFLSVDNHVDSGVVFASRANNLGSL